VSRDEQDDVVEIGVVVEARDPRLIWRARMGGLRISAIVITQIAPS